MSEHEKMDEELVMWTAGAHTATSLEVQAVRLWANKTAGMLKEQGGPVSAALAAFLKGCASDDDETLAKMLLSAKESESQAGREPMSAEPIQEH